MHDTRAQILEASTTIKNGESLFLNMDELRPGDVLLTRSSHLISKVIAQITSGPFSHAALVVTRDKLFESRFDGIGITDLSECVSESNASEVNLGNCSLAVVLRHVQLSQHVEQARDFNDPLGKINARIIDRIKSCDYLGKSYPPTKKLLSTLDIPEVFRALAIIILDGIDKIRGYKPYAAGPFCSELVADILHYAVYRRTEDASVDLIASPNTFLNSQFMPVCGALQCKLAPKSPTIEDGRQGVQKLNQQLEFIEGCKELGSIMFGGNDKENGNTGS